RFRILPVCLSEVLVAQPGRLYDNYEGEDEYFPGIVCGGGLMRLMTARAARPEAEPPPDLSRSRTSVRSIRIKDRRFGSVRSPATSLAILSPVTSCCNSSGTIRRPATRLTMPNVSRWMSGRINRQFNSDPR